MSSGFRAFYSFFYTVNLMPPWIPRGDEKCNLIEILDDKYAVTRIGECGH